MTALITILLLFFMAHILDSSKLTGSEGTLIFMQRLSFRGLYQGVWGKSRGAPCFGRDLPLKKPCYVAVHITFSFPPEDILLQEDRDGYHDFPGRGDPITGKFLTAIS